MAVWINDITRIEKDFLKKKKVNIRSKRKLEIISLSFLFVVLFSQLCIRLAITEISYSIERARVEALQSDGKLREKRLELAEMLAPINLSKVAAKKLGMVEGTKDNIKKIFNKGD